MRELASSLQGEMFGKLTKDELATLHGLLLKLADS